MPGLGRIVSHRQHRRGFKSPAHHESRLKPNHPEPVLTGFRNEPSTEVLGGGRLLSHPKSENESGERVGALPPE